MSGAPVQFSEDAAKRVVKATKWVEQQANQIGQVGSSSRHYGGGGSKVKIVKVTGYNTTTQLYAGTVQKLSAGIPYSYVDTDPAQEIEFYDFTGISVALSDEYTNTLVGSIVPVFSTTAGNFAIGQSFVFRVTCYADGGTEGSGAGAGTNDSITFTAYYFEDTGKLSPLGTALTPKRPRFPGCEYKRPTSYATAGMMGLAVWEWDAGTPTLVLLDIIEERPKLALRLDSGTDQLILEGGETTAGGTRAISFNRTQETACPS